MCELLGINDNYEINPEFSFKELKVRGGGTRAHRHGWGIGLYEQNGKANIDYKEPKPAYNSPLAQEIASGRLPLSSKIFIAHIRYKSSGEPTINNTHPFKQHLFGKDWIFAHNGTLPRVFDLDTGMFTPGGDTDSEHAFCYILDQIKSKCTKTSSLDELVLVLEGCVREIKAVSGGNFNFILSDGTYIFAHGDNSLYYTLRSRSNQVITLDDSDYGINLSDMKREGEKAAIIATSPLTKEEKWIQFKGIYIFKDGERVYPKKSMSNQLSDLELDVLRTIKNSPHKISIAHIATELKMPNNKIKNIILLLLDRKYIRKDSAKDYEWDDDDAEYFTTDAGRLALL
jgi:predicted glutamine amidotransferase